MAPSEDDGLANFRLTVGYDGRGFHGWQRLRGVRTVQGALEDACSAVFGRHGPAQGASRTDRGVHAEGQVVSMRLPGELETGAALAQLGEALPGDLRVHALTAASDGFHAREAAVGKLYRYVLWSAESCPESLRGRVWAFAAPLDLAAMRAAGGLLVGRHDFAAFAKRPRSGGGDSVRELHKCAVEAGASESEKIVFEVVGNSFLFRMVRNLVSALVRVGEGRWSPAEVAGLLAEPVRPPGAGTAPADGLYLDAVYYPGEPFPPA